VARSADKSATDCVIVVEGVADAVGNGVGEGVGSAEIALTQLKIARRQQILALASVRVRIDKFSGDLVCISMESCDPSF
jgi:hypothetical protein